MSDDYKSLNLEELIKKREKMASDINTFKKIEIYILNIKR